ncbi:MAG: AAA family ATPase [Rhizobiales bacterium]|nr:AAA family ATPase [Hyphomicrobiales bacterium]
MSTEPSIEHPCSAHVVVLGNEKGGSGKSTIAMHVAVALMKSGQRVATIDLDCRQQSLTHYIEHRRSWAKRQRINLEIPTHHCVARANGPTVEGNEAAEFEDFANAITAVEKAHEFVVIDTPGTDDYLMRLGHSMADTLITPLNDSFVDFDVLAAVDPATFAVTNESQYAEMVCEARRQRQLVDGGLSDWVVVCNRLSMLGSRNKRLVDDGLIELGRRLGFRLADGIGERVIYREFFPRGLTALDDLDEVTLGTRPSMSHVSAREEVIQLFAALRLPLNERGRQHAAARAEWQASMSKPLEMYDLLAEA